MIYGAPMTVRKIAVTSLGICLWGSVLFAASSADFKRLYDPVVRRLAASYGVPEDLIHAIIRAESDYDNFALSEKGAMGLMQLMPETAEQYGVRNVFDPTQNIEGGTKYLKDLMKLYDKKTDLVLAAYNAGQEAVRKYGSIPPYPETREYIKRVKAKYNKSEIGPRIIKMYDASGKLILTNDPEYFKLKKD
jgi:soluble lytic murein transglycosylase-like protein